MKLVVISDYPTNNQISQIENLTEGIDTVIIDISKALYPETDLIYQSNKIKCFKINERKEVINYIKSIKDIAVILNVSFMYKNIDIFKAISKDCYSIYPRVNGLPNSQKIISTKIRRFWELNYGTFIFNHLPLWSLGLRYPNAILYDGRIALEQSKRFIGKNTDIINIKSYDCDKILNDNKIYQETETIVFLEEGIINHPDYDLLGISHNIIEKDYYQKMNRFFEYLENKFGYKIIIAAHPKSLEEDLKRLFNRKVIKGDTLNLIRKSKFVVAHGSTTIGIAVLLNKPIILLVNKQIKKTHYVYWVISSYAAELDIKPINIDNENFYINLSINQNKYDIFIKDHMWNKNDFRKNSEILKGIKPLTTYE